MSKELLLVVDAVANEKGVPESVIFEAIEAALASAAKKRYPDQDVLVRVQIDPKDGNYETYRRWEVVADDVVMESPDRQIRLWMRWTRAKAPKSATTSNRRSKTRISAASPRRPPSR